MTLAMWSPTPGINGELCVGGYRRVGHPPEVLLDEGDKNVQVGIMNLK